MKKIKKLEPLKPFEIKGNLFAIRGGEYWDTHPIADGHTWDDHTCPNGNELIKKDSFRPL